ncbi:MAG: PAS domain-containing protein [Acidobacteriota bacterium]
MNDPSSPLYRWLIDHGRGLICAHDRLGKLLLVNRAAASSLGRRPEELVGRRLAEFLHPTIEDQFDAYLVRIWSRGRDRGLMRLVHRDGSSRMWSYDNVFHRPDDGSGVVLGFAHDVSEEKLSGWAERRRDRRLEILFEESVSGMGRVDFERSPALDQDPERLLAVVLEHGYVGDCNRAFAEQYGAASSAELSRVPVRHLPLFNHPDYRPAVRSFLQQGCRSADLRLQQRDPAGARRDYRVNLVGVTEDGALSCLWLLQSELPSAD